MIRLKTREEIERMKRAGHIVASVFEAIEPMMVPGVPTLEIDRIAHEVIVNAGAIPSFLGYDGQGPTPFPGSTCISIDDEVVHGFPSERVIEEGMIISVDVGAYIDGYHGDAARTFIIGDVPDRVRELVEVTREAFYKGLEQARPGNRLGDISHAVQSHCESHGFGVIRELTGHGVGTELHEPPNLLNYGRPGRGIRLAAGMVMALEPMITLGRPEIVIGDNEWTFLTADGSPAAHHENTFAITEDGPIILTALSQSSEPV